MPNLPGDPEQLTLDARVRRLEDRAEIEELLVRYAVFVDDHEYDQLGQLFVDDAVFRTPGSTHRGKAAIVASYRANGERYPISVHVARGLVLELHDDDHASGAVLGFAEQASAEHTVITTFRYEDEYVRGADGRWRFAVRSVRTLYALSHAELASGGLGWDLRKRWPHRQPARAELPSLLPTSGG